MNARAKQETLAFIVADFYDARDAQNAFYNKFADRLDGFVGVRNFLVDAANAFIYWEGEMLNEWDGQFPEATEDYANLLLAVEKIPNNEELRKMAKRVLLSNGAKFGKFPKYATTRNISGQRLKELACQQCGRAISDCRGHDGKA